MRDRRRAERAGRVGETAAAWWLRLKGWRILARRVRTPAGEVDLIARRGNLIAFVEVKRRATGEQLDFAIDHARLQSIRTEAHRLTPARNLERTRSLAVSMFYGVG